MTSPNEWWKEEPYTSDEPPDSCKDPGYHHLDYCMCGITTVNIPLIIEEVKRREKKTAEIIQTDGIESEWSCGACKSELSHTEIDGAYCLWCGAEFE